MVTETYHPETSRHQCLIYSGPSSEQLPVLTPVINERLKTNYRCLYLGPPEMVAMMQAALRSEGIDVEAEIQRGALIFSSDRDHLRDGGFDPAAMLETLSQLIDQAVNEGFQGLFATGDMMWELGTEANVERLQEYEALLEKMFREKPLAGVCQYHMDTLPERAVRDALRTHQSVYLGHSVNTDNLFYMPPELLLENAGAAIRDRQGEWMWQQINRISRAESERDKALAQLARQNENLEQRVRERTAELETSNHELETFCYAVSHDLRTPLRAIDGFSQAILERDVEKLDATGKSDFARVRAATQRMAQLIDGLLNLSRVIRCDIKREPVDMSRQAQLIVQELQRVAPERRVAIDIEPGVMGQGDPRLLSSALGNLLENAWKFTAKKNGAQISFGATQKDGRAIYWIRDNGAGFDMAAQSQLFGPFQRLHSAKDYPGTGIGLATVQRIIRRHGGQIWAEAQPDQGAAFFFTLFDAPH